MGESPRPSERHSPIGDSGRVVRAIEGQSTIVDSRRRLQLGHEGYSRVEACDEGSESRAVATRPRQIRFSITGFACNEGPKPRAVATITRNVSVNIIGNGQVSRPTMRAANAFPMRAKAEQLFRFSLQPPPSPRQPSMPAMIRRAVRSGRSRPFTRSAGSSISRSLLAAIASVTGAFRGGRSTS